MKHLKKNQTTLSETQSIIASTLACPYDFSRLIQDNSNYICCSCGKTYPCTCGTINFLVYEESFKNLSYEIPWHPVPKPNLYNLLISKLRRFPFYQRLWITGDYFSFFLERLIFNATKKHKKIVDVGCREGKNLLFSSWAEFYVGVDIDFPSVQYANNVSPFNAKAFLATGTALPFKEKSFDLVICTEVIEHLAEYKKLVQNLARVCESGGEIILSTPNGRVVPKPYALHHKHFNEKELIELFSPFFEDIKIYSIVRNCSVKKPYWQLRNKYSSNNVIVILVSLLTNLVYLLKGYHSEGSDNRDDVTDANFILVGRRR